MRDYNKGIQRVVITEGGNTLDYEAGIQKVELHTPDLIETMSDLTKVKSDLASITTNVKSFGAKGDGATIDNSALDSAIASLQGNKGVIFFPPANSYYKITKDLTIPNGVSLVSNGATIHTTGKITLSGNNKISGIIFDGKWATGGIDVRGSNCSIYDNTFLNSKQSKDAMTNVINVENTHSASIHHNIFDGIKSYDESLTNKNGSVSRAIRVSDSHNVRIESNTFDNMDGYADSDYIHVIGLNSFVENDIFPYNSTDAVIRGVYTLKKGIVIRDNTIYHAKCKSDIKIQDSGVLIEGNAIYMDSRLDADVYNNAMRVYNSVDTVIHNNKIIVDSTYARSILNVAFSENITLTENKFNVKVESDSNLTGESNFISLNSINKLKVYKNEFNVIAKDTLFYLNAVKNSTFSVNELSLKASSTNTLTLFTFKTSSGLVDTESISILNNDVISEVSDIEVKINNIGTTKNIELIKNIIKEGQTSISLSNVNGLTLSDNFIKIKPLYFITFQSGSGTIENVTITGNTFDNSVWTSGNLNIIRGYKAVTNFIYSRNDVTKPPVIPSSYTFMYNTGSNQDLNAVTYIPGNIPTKEDVGNTSGRNPYNKPNNFMYFDTTLGKPIWWNGSAWKDATGTTV